MRIKTFFIIIFMLQWASPTFAQKKDYPLFFDQVDKDNPYKLEQLGLVRFFNGHSEAEKYIYALPSMLTSKGFPLASLDSIEMQDSLARLKIYLGRRYTWVQLQSIDVEPSALAYAGYYKSNFEGKPFEINRLQTLQRKILEYYERNGYPFAKIWMDSVSVGSDSIFAKLRVEKMVEYRIDSMRVIGGANISKKFLQHYLDIKNNEIYNAAKLQNVDKRMAELPYVKVVQPADVTLLRTGAIVNLYLENKRSSRVDFLVGMMPSSGIANKFIFTYDVNLNLLNMFGTGEGLLLKAQQLQQKSPRFNLGYDQPYIFNSPFGTSFLFDLFKKDSNFLQLNAHAGISYAISQKQTAKLFVQYQNNTLQGGAIDTNIVKATHRLPEDVDVRSINVGFQYHLQNTDYRFNPRKGAELQLTLYSGMKTISKSNEILKLKDPGFNFASLYDSIKLKSYQIRLKLNAAKYIPINRSAVLKMGLASAFYESPSVFRNELFQIGGYQLLRGFDEESIYANVYGIATAEYRQLIGANSYLFGFIDGGFVRNKVVKPLVTNQFVGTGLGIVYETKAGLLNLSVALGKRSDISFNIRNATKIHFGYINYF